MGGTDTKRWRPARAQLRGVLQDFVHELAPSPSGDENVGATTAQRPQKRRRAPARDYPRPAPAPRPPPPPPRPCRAAPLVTPRCAPPLRDTAEHARRVEPEPAPASPGAGARAGPPAPLPPATGTEPGRRRGRPPNNGQTAGAPPVVAPPQPVAKKGGRPRKSAVVSVQRKRGRPTKDKGSVDDYVRWLKAAGYEFMLLAPKRAGVDEMRHRAVVWYRGTPWKLDSALLDVWPLSGDLRKQLERAWRLPPEWCLCEARSPVFG